MQKQSVYLFALFEHVTPAVDLCLSKASRRAQTSKRRPAGDQTAPSRPGYHEQNSNIFPQRLSLARGIFRPYPLQAAAPGKVSRVSERRLAPGHASSKPGNPEKTSRDLHRTATLWPLLLRFPWSENLQTPPRKRTYVIIIEAWSSRPPRMRGRGCYSDKVVMGEGMSYSTSASILTHPPGKVRPDGCLLLQITELIPIRSWVGRERRL